MARIESVLGSIDPNHMGITFMHEHIICDLSAWLIQPTEISKMKLVDAPVKMENLGILRRDPVVSKDNLKIIDEGLAVKELMDSKNWGARTVVDLSTPGIGRDPDALRRISLATGLNIIMGTGWYTAVSQPQHIRKKNVDDLHQIILEEISSGVGNTGIKPGVIGEIGCSGPVPYHPDEKKVLQAAARVQKETGICITIHPAFLDKESRQTSGLKNWEVYLDLIEEEGGNLMKLYMSHADRLDIDLNYLRQIMDRGITISFDGFGKEPHFESFGIFVLGATDPERVKSISELCKEGYDRRIVLSHDVCVKTDLKTYGGMGYSHILERIVSALNSEGVSGKQIDNMLVENPKRLLQF